MLRNGLEGRLVSQVKIFPLACPPAIVEWSAEIARDVKAPDSTAVKVVNNSDRQGPDREKAPTFCSRPNDHLEILVEVEHQDDSF